jgi:hypothetical protein
VGAELEKSMAGCEIARQARAIGVAVQVAVHSLNFFDLLTNLAHVALKRRRKAEI